MVEATHLPPLAEVAGSCTCSWSSLHTACGSWCWGGGSALSPKYWGLVFWSPITSSEHRGTHTQEASGYCCCTSPHCCKFPCSYWLKWLLGNLKGWFLLSWLFFSFPVPAFESQALKTRIFESNCIYKENQKVTTYSQGKAQAQKRP